MKGLKSEHESMVRDLVQTDSWKAVIAYCEAISLRQAEAVVNYNLSQGPRGLTILKANLDGARQLIAGLQQAKRDLKIKD